MKDKKIVVISICSVIALVIAIIGISYAMFTANLTGTEENRLNTGYVKMNCEETTFTLDSSSAMSDEAGIAAEDNAATCTLTTEMNGSMKIGYDIALAEVDQINPDDGLDANNVKAQIFKVVDSGDPQYLGSSSATEGVFFSTLKSKSGNYDKTITDYVIDSIEVSSTQTVVYTIKAWIATAGAGGSSNVVSTPAACSDESIDSEDECKAAGEIWGPLQTESQEGGSFSFKLKIGAAQVLS